MIDDHPEIAAFHARWADAMSRGDVDAVMSMLEPSYVLWLPNAPVMTRDAMRPILATTFARGRVDVPTLTPATGESARSGRQRVTVVLRRGEDGEWRFAWGMGLGAEDPR